MNLFRTLSTVAAAGLAGFGLNSCLQAPNYPIVPHIEENAVTVFRRNSALGPRDSVEIALNFEDGDGDLGLKKEDTTGVYAYKKGTNKFYNNYFIQTFYKKNGGFVPLVRAFSDNGRYMYLPKEGSPAGPLKGVLRYAIPFSLIDPATAPGTELQFQISIADRALHESNVITTSSVKL